MKENKKEKERTLKKLRVMTAGMVIMDYLSVDLDSIPQPGVPQFAENADDRVGGHPANVAIDLAKLGMNPREIGVIAAVGRDARGGVIEQELHQYGISALFQKVGRITARNCISVPKGQDRIFVIYPGANLELSAEHVKAQLAEHRPDALSIRPGYSGIDGEIASIIQDLPETFVLLDLMKPYKREWSYIIPALKHANAVHCNDMEAMEVAGTKTVEEAIDAFLSYGLELIFLTYGEEGAQLITRNINIRQPGFKVHTVDPTGCGDAFCAGVIQKLLEWDATRNVDALSEEQFGELLRYGQAVGAAAATGIGCTAGVSKERVQKILAG